MKREWSEGIPLSHELPTGLRVRAGVYRIRAWKAGEPLKIPRLNGIDREGILHIGKSHNLFQRLKSVQRAVILGKRPAHFAGVQFMKWRFNEVIPVEDLRFDSIGTRSEADARKLETELHQLYRKKFLDRPPLDGTSGARFKGIIAL